MSHFLELSTLFLSPISQLVPEDSRTGCIEVATELLPSQSTENVYVTPLPWVRNAFQVQMEPLTCDDWDLLRIYASDLERGEMLRQVSIVYEGQVLPLQVRQGVLAQVRVESVTTSIDSLMKHSGSATHDTHDYFIAESFPCVRLVADTEIVISPKEPLATPSDPSLRVIPCWEDYSTAMQNVAKTTTNLMVVRLPQGMVALHPDLSTWSRTIDDGRELEECYVQIFSLENRRGDDVQGGAIHISDPAIAKVLWCDHIPTDSIGTYEIGHLICFVVTS